MNQQATAQFLEFIRNGQICLNCNHEEKLHSINHNKPLQVICHGWMQLTYEHPNYGAICSCIKFQMDNLKYLEQVNEQQDLHTMLEESLTMMANTKLFSKDKLCSLCHVSEFIHGKGLHPFFNNNLEFLEWKHTQNEKNH